MGSIRRTTEARQRPSWLCAALLLSFESVEAFILVKGPSSFSTFPTSYSPLPKVPRVRLFQKARGSTAENIRQKEEQRDRLQRLALTEQLLKLDEGSTLIPVQFVGQASLPAVAMDSDFVENVDCAVLSTSATPEQSFPDPQACLLIPIQPSNRLGLLRRLFSLSSLRKNGDSSSTMTRRELLGWNTLIVNRDNGLFDNLPFASWDNNQKTSVDAAGQAIAPRFHLGKRECYNRMLGKDWYRDPVLIINNKNKEESDVNILKRRAADEQTDADSSIFEFLMEQIQSRLERETNSQDYKQAEVDSANSSGDSTTVEYDDFADMMLDSVSQPQGDENSATTIALTRRILELQLREFQMQMAECDSEIAQLASSSSSNNNPTTEAEMEAWQQKKQESIQNFQDTQERLDELLQSPNSNDDNIVSSIVSELLGSKSKADKETEFDGGGTPLRRASSYKSPFAILKEIIAEQMNAQVIAAVLENGSLLENTITITGLIVLQRIPETVTLLGENLTLASTETILVECDADEAIGMSLTSENGIPLWMESSVWQRGSTMAQRISEGSRDSSGLGLWKTLDPELSVLMEGQALNQSVTERILPVRTPRGEPSRFDRLVFQQKRNTQQDVKLDLFPTDNQVTSLKQFDEMSNDDKARTLMSMSNFRGLLPRPRVQRSSSVNALDRLLLPLIDESVRTLYQIREARQQGDVERLTQLEASKSLRLQTRERAEEARQVGDEALAEEWEQEDEFLKSLRADITQDEGSYSRFLDRDEWYERNRQRLAKRVDKSKFGNLLDDIE